MRRTDTLLVDQMKLTDIEIRNRMQLLDLDTESLDFLAKHKVLIETNIDAIVNEFYEKQTAIEEISQLIGDADTLTHLRNAQRKYVLDLFSGHYDREYVNNRLRIGMVHKRIGVEPKLYLSAVRTLKEGISKVFRRHLTDTNELDKTLSTLVKLFYFDTTLVFDTYIASLLSEIETEKHKTEEYAKSLEIIVAERTKQLEDLAKLDALTGLYNRRTLEDVLERELAVVKRRDNILSLIYFDIDKFKSVNDTDGHLAGDEILKTTGKAMLANIREVDVACRYGGDEFCIILPDCDGSNAQVVAEKIIANFESAYPDLSLSVGISSARREQLNDLLSLIKDADRKMYEAKKHAGSYIYI
jgi:diguanylate cyclase (GGDEF)-like protein